MHITSSGFVERFCLFCFYYSFVEWFCSGVSACFGFWFRVLFVPGSLRCCSLLRVCFRGARWHFHLVCVFAIGFFVAFLRVLVSGFVFFVCVFQQHSQLLRAGVFSLLQVFHTLCVHAFKVFFRDFFQFFSFFAFSKPIFSNFFCFLHFVVVNRGARANITQCLLKWYTLRVPHIIKPGQPGKTKTPALLMQGFSKVSVVLTRQGCQNIRQVRSLCFVLGAGTYMRQPAMRGSPAHRQGLLSRRTLGSMFSGSHSFGSVHRCV